GRCSMPGDLVFHEADSLPLHGVRHDEGGLALDTCRSVQTVGDLSHVVAVDLQDVPVERAPLVDHRLEWHHLIHVTVDLSVVVVEDRSEGIHLVFRGAHRRFPDLSLLRLAISDYAVDVELAAVELRSDGHALSN